jgi:hypothetical protein
MASIFSLSCPTVILAEESNHKEQILFESSTIKPGDQPIKVIISKKAQGLHVRGAKWDITYEHHVKLGLVPDQTRTYLIEMICEEKELSLCVLDSNNMPVAVGSQSEIRLHRKTVITDLEGGKCYSIAIGAGLLEHNVTFRIWATANTQDHMPCDPLRKTKTIEVDSEYEGHVTEKSQIFEKRLCHFLKPEPSKGQRQWVTAELKSNDFDPLLILLNPSDEIVDLEIGEQSKKSAVLTIKPDQRDHLIIITSLKRIAKGKAVTSLDYVFKTKASTYDPAKGVIGLISHKFQNPLLTFGAGLLVALLVGYVYYEKMFHVKKISYTLLTDRLIADDRGKELPVFALAESHAPLVCASLCRIKLWHSGRSRIPSEFVRSPIQLNFLNVKRVLNVRQEKRTGGWLSPEVSPEQSTTVVVKFKSLDPGDKTVFSAVCEQEEPGPIDLKVNHDISETELDNAGKDTPQLLIWLFRLLWISCLIVTPLFLLDIYFNFIPYSILRGILRMSFVIMYLNIVFFVFSRFGRRVFRDTILYIWHEPVDLLQRQLLKFRKSPKGRQDSVENETNGKSTKTDDASSAQ